MDEVSYYKFHPNSLRNKYPSLASLKDYELFTIYCIKNFFYSETIPFDQDLILKVLTDGSSDGGIDAVFNDPNSEANDMIIVQSKFYDNSQVNDSDIFGEIYKASDTMKNSSKNKVSQYNETVVSAYRNAMSQMEDEGKMRFYFFTSHTPKNKKDKNTLVKKINATFPDFYDISINYGNDVKAEIESINNSRDNIEYDELIIDKPNDSLKYEDSVIVNISAMSLQDIQNRRRNSLLGMNLRYYVKNKGIDGDIADTIKKDSENFWYKNNGILIVCERYELDGTFLKLHNFSIVNGGQITTMIGNSDLPSKDFFLQCKVIQAKGINEEWCIKFINSIAKATNYQKPIKIADLKANSDEQRLLKRRLMDVGVYYITKQGEKPTKQYSEPYSYANLDLVGKLSLAGILQMPGSARSNSQKMFSDDNYFPIFGPSSREQFIADLLRINYYYQDFLKTGLSEFRDKIELPMIKNRKTFIIASIGFYSKILSGEFSYDTLKNYIADTDQTKSILRLVTKVDRIYRHKVDNEKELTQKLFRILGEEDLGYVYQNELENAENNNRTLVPSDFLKLDSNYYKLIIPRLMTRYKNSRELSEVIEKIL